MQRRLTIIAVLLLVAGGFMTRGVKSEPVMPRAPLETFPMRIGDWAGTPAAELEPAVREALGVDAYVNRVYSLSNTASVGLYLGYYESQRRGRTMHSPLNCLPGAGWQPVTHDLSRIELASHAAAGQTAAVTVNRYVVEKGLERLLVFYWYQAHGRVVASEYSARFYLVADALRINRTDGALVRIVTPLEDGSPDAAERRAVAFITSMFPILGRYLPA